MPRPHTHSSAQKALIALLFTMMGLVFLQHFFWSDFIVREAGVLIGLAFAFAISIAVAIGVEIANRRGAWVLDPLPLMASPLKQVVGWMSLVLLVFALSWFVASWPLARLYTVFTGVPGSFVVAVEKVERSSDMRKGMSCTYSVRFVGASRPANFRYCLSNQQYSRLPDGVFNVRFHGESSGLGMRVRRFTIER